jgi:hypothetical protein
VRVEKISLVVSTRWRTLEVKRLLESLLAQTYTTFEVDSRLCCRSTAIG